MPEKSIQTPHDRLIKRTFTPEVAAEFFQAYLSPSITCLIEWDNLRLEQGSFVDEHMRASHTDLLFTARMAGRPVSIYILLEHQTHADQDLPIRIGEYLFRIWGEILRKENSAAFPLPRIIPVVLHQGKPWTAPRRLAEIVVSTADLEPAAQAELGRWLPDFEMEVIDLPQQDFRQIRGHLIGRTVLALMQAASQKRVPEFFHEYLDLVQELLSQPNFMSIVETLLVYSVHVTDDREKLMSVLTTLPDPILKERAMSVADQLKAEGRVEGRSEGLIESLMLMLEERFGTASNELRPRVQTLSMDLIRSLITVTLRSNSLEEIVSWLNARRVLDSTN